MSLNEILQGRLPRGIQRFFGIQGEAPAPQLSQLVTPTYNLTTLPADHQYLFDIRLCSRFFDVTGDATHPGQVQLYNPTGSGQLVIVRGFWLCGVASPQLIQIRDVNAAALLALNQQGMVNDARWFPRVAVSSIRGAADQNALGVVLGVVESGSGWTPYDYVLTPGTWLTLASSLNAIRVTGMFVWTERGLPELERSF